MHYDRDGLELVNPNDQPAARVLRRYKSERLYGKDYESPKYVLPFFYAACIGAVMIIFGTGFLLFSVIGPATSMLLTGVVISIPQAIYWFLTSVNEERLGKLVEDGRIRAL